MPKENNKLMNGLRWITVVPGALIAAFLVTFPLHWLLYLGFAYNGTLLGFIELSPGANVAIEHTLTPFAIAITFILAGYKIAPSHKFRVSAVMTVLYVLVFISALLLAPEQYHLEPRGVLAILGSFLALYLAWRQSKPSTPRLSEAQLEQMAQQEGQETVKALNSLADEDNDEVGTSDSRTSRQLVALVSTKGKTSKEVARELNENVRKYEESQRAKIIEYADYSKDMPLDCPACGWHGTPQSSEYIEYHDDVLDVSCPNCKKMLLVVEYLLNPDFPQK